MIKFGKILLGAGAAALLATTFLHAPAHGAEDMHVVPAPRPR